MTKQKRQYKRITPATIAKHKALEILKGNGTAAVIESDPEYQAPHDRAYRIRTKSEQVNTLDYIDDSMQQIGAEAIQELGELVHSSDERVRTKNVHYAIDRIAGRPVVKSESKHLSISIESVLN